MKHSAVRITLAVSTIGYMSPSKIPYASIVCLILLSSSSSNGWIKLEGESIWGKSICEADFGVSEVSLTVISLHSPSMISPWTIQKGDGADVGDEASCDV